MKLILLELTKNDLQRAPYRQIAYRLLLQKQHN